MTWTVLAQLLVQFGPSAFQLAERLIAKWDSKEPVTQADLDELTAMGVRSGRDAVIEALVRNNIPLESLAAYMPAGSQIQK